MGSTEANKPLGETQRFLSDVIRSVIKFAFVGYVAKMALDSVTERGQK